MIKSRIIARKAARPLNDSELAAVNGACANQSTANWRTKPGGDACLH